MQIAIKKITPIFLAFLLLMSTFQVFAKGAELTDDKLKQLLPKPEELPITEGMRALGVKWSQAEIRKFWALNATGKGYNFKAVKSFKLLAVKGEEKRRFSLKVVWEGSIIIAFMSSRQVAGQNIVIERYIERVSGVGIGVNDYKKTEFGLEVLKTHKSKTSNYLEKYVAYSAGFAYYLHNSKIKYKERELEIAVIGKLRFYRTRLEDKEKKGWKFVDFNYKKFDPKAEMEHYEKLTNYLKNYITRLKENLKQYIAIKETITKTTMTTRTITKKETTTKTTKPTAPATIETKTALLKKDYVRITRIQPIRLSYTQTNKTNSFLLSLSYSLVSAETGVIEISLVYEHPDGDKVLGYKTISIKKGFDKKLTVVSAYVPQKIGDSFVKSIRIFATLFSNGATESEIYDYAYISIWYPPPVFQIELSKDTAIANGTDKVKVTVRVTDEQGNPSKDRPLIVNTVYDRKVANVLVGYNKLESRGIRQHKVYLETDKDGIAIFSYVAPKIDRSKYPRITAKNNPFPIYDKFVIEDELSGAKKEVKIKLLPPDPIIRKIETPFGADVGTWLPIKVEIEDADSKQFRYGFYVIFPKLFAKKEILGEFKHGKTTKYGNAITIISNKKSEHVGYLVPQLGVNVRELPSLAHKLWEATKDVALGAFLELAKEPAKIKTIYSKAKAEAKFVGSKMPTFVKEYTTKIAKKVKMPRGVTFVYEKAKDGVVTLARIGQYRVTEKMEPGTFLKWTGKMADINQLINPYSRGGTAIDFVKRTVGIKNAYDAVGAGLTGVQTIVGVLGLVNKLPKSIDPYTFALDASITYAKAFLDYYSELKTIAEAKRIPFIAFLTVVVWDEKHKVQEIRIFKVYYYTTQSSPDNAFELMQADKEKTAIIATLNKYYEASKKEDINSYVATLDLEGLSDVQVKATKDIALKAWKVFNTLNYRISNAKVYYEGNLATVWYHVKGTVEGVEKGKKERLNMEYDAVALLKKVGNEWKIDTITTEEQFVESVYVTSLVKPIVDIRSKAIGEYLDKVALVEVKDVKISPDLSKRVKTDTITLSLSLEWIKEMDHYNLSLALISPDGEVHEFSKKYSRPLTKVEINVPSNVIREYGKWNYIIYINDNEAYNSSFNVQYIPKQEIKLTRVKKEEVFKPTIVAKQKKSAITEKTTKKVTTPERTTKLTTGKIELEKTQDLTVIYPVIGLIIVVGAIILARKRKRKSK